MRELKTQESEKFIKFHQLIQNEAQKKGSVFFGFCGEGNDFETDEMEGEDLTGWLIPEEKADEFEKKWIVNSSLGNLEEWSDFFIWVEWKRIGEKIEIEFVEYG